MNRVVGVRWYTAAPIAYADAGELEMRVKNYVVLQAEKGQEFGWVPSPLRRNRPGKVGPPLL